MRATTSLLVAALTFGAVLPALAQTGTPLPEDITRDKTRAGTRGANFLEIGVGARAQSLAGAITSDVSGISALYWNTAGIARAEQAMIGFSLSPLFEGFDMQFGHAGGILPLGAGAIGLSITYLSSGEMDRTDASYPEGGNPIRPGTFSYNGTAVSLHYGRLLTDRLALGGALRYAQEGFDGASANYVGVDIGTQFRTGLFGTTLGAAISNVGTEGRFTGTALRHRTTTGIPDAAGVTDVQRTATAFAMPTVFRFSVTTDILGAADAVVGPHALHTLKLFGDVSDATTAPIQSAIAAEYGFRELVFARAGYRFHNDPRAAWEGSHGLSLGAGLAVPLGESRLSFDYAYQPWGVLNNVQIFSLEFSF
jgi:hypothetical protein